MVNSTVATYLQQPIYLLAARDHDYRLESPMAMRMEAATISPGPLSKYVLGAYAAVAMLSTRRIWNNPISRSQACPSEILCLRQRQGQRHLSDPRHSVRPGIIVHISVSVLRC